MRRTVAMFGAILAFVVGLTVASSRPATAQQLCQSETLCVHDQMPIWNGHEALNYLNQYIPPYNWTWSGAWCGGTAAAMIFKSYARELALAGTPVTGTYSWITSGDPGVVLYNAFDLVGDDLAGNWYNWGLGGATGDGVRGGYNVVFKDSSAGRSASLDCYDYQGMFWGCSQPSPAPSVSSFRNGYQRPFVHLMIGPGVGIMDHSVVINGTEGSNLYKIFDPYSGDIYDVTINGNWITWNSGDQSGRVWIEPAHDLLISQSIILWNYGASSPVLTAPAISIPVVGWNLVGNGYTGTIDFSAPTVFGDPNKVVTVWKWLAASSKWAFYTPRLPDGGAAYAISKGYEPLTLLTHGDGFWVNASATFSVQLPWSAPVTLSSFHYMDSSGWNLIAVGENGVNLNPVTAPGFEQAIGPYRTLWAWDAYSSRWYFYAPELAAQGGTVLSDFIAQHGYLDFGNQPISSTTGLWVNKSTDTPPP